MKKQLLLRPLAAYSSWLNSVLVLLLGIAVLCASPRITHAQVTLVKDIGTGNSNDPEAFGPMIQHNNKLYFQYYQELWRSDGTTAGTVRIEGFDYMANIV